MSGIIDLDRCLLYEQLQIHLNELEPALRDDVVEALSVEGKLLHQPASAQDGNWALLPFCLAMLGHCQTPEMNHIAAD